MMRRRATLGASREAGPRDGACLSWKSLWKNVLSQAQRVAAPSGIALALLLALAPVSSAQVDTGSIEGTSTVDMLYTRTPGEGESFSGAGYVALERIAGSVDGREGSFVLLHISTVVGNEPPLSRYLISPGSGTGALSGISGVGLITIADDGSHTLHLDYELG